MRISRETFALSFQGKPVVDKLAELDKVTNGAVDDLLCWTNAFRTASG